jgi:transcriptional regulator with XRE-family HTH domain
MTATMGRRPKSLEKEWVPLTPFQEWLDKALERKGWDLKHLAASAGVDYSNLWRVARGNPNSYPGRNRLSVDTVTSVGLLLGDVFGALESCNYPAITSGRPTIKPSPYSREALEALMADTPGLEPLPEIERIPDEDELLAGIQAYTGDHPTLMAAKAFQMALDAAKARGNVTGEEPEDELVYGRGPAKGIVKVDGKK